MIALLRKNVGPFFNYSRLHTMSTRPSHTEKLPTHFICIKLSDTSIKSNYVQFKVNPDTIVQSNIISIKFEFECIQ